MKIYFISLILFTTTVFAQEVIFYVHGGAMKSYVNDKIIVSSSKINLTTISPSFSTYPNVIGEFEDSISDEEFKEITSFIKSKLPKITNPKYQPSGGALVLEIQLDNEKRFWTSANDNKETNEIQKKFFEIAKRVYKNPIKALKAECDQDKSKKLINCSYINVGKHPVKTINPMGVTYSMRCLDLIDSQSIINDKGEANPKKMAPEKISINPGESFKFSIKSEDSCHFRIVIKTTDLLINNNYKDVLLGELVTPLL